PAAAQRPPDLAEHRRSLTRASYSGHGAAGRRDRAGHRVDRGDRQGDRDPRRGLAVAAACGPNAAFVAADLADPGAARSLVEATTARFGGLTVLVNNAAAAEPDGSVADLDDARWRTILEIDLLAPARLCRAAMPH